MGEVYKARDTRLDRSVAIKVLPPQLAHDPEFRERFDREARAISQLSHPNICTLYDVGEAVISHQSSVTSQQTSVASPQSPAGGEETVRFLVMELLDGQTLAHRLRGAGRVLSEPPGSAGSTGPGLQIDQALTIAIQIAEALAAAHRAGLVHRDLKPGNIMLTKTGAKLLDFGLAKASGSVKSANDLTMALTTPPAMTAQGAIVGTFQYMAPEQIEGRDADARSDLFAFGCVLYEMLTGRKAFEGKSHASLIGAIMHAEPQPLSTVSPTIPPPLDRIVTKCLAKDPDARWQSARDLVDELKWIAGSGASTASATAISLAPAKRPSSLAWAVAAIAVLTAVVLGLALAGVRKAPERPALSARFTITMPEGWTISATGIPAAAAALSPDGKYFVMTGTVKDETPSLWLRPIDAVEARRIPRTHDASLPFFSPDSQSIGFYDAATRQLKRTNVNGDPASVICDATNPQGAD